MASRRGEGTVDIPILIDNTDGQMDIGAATSTTSRRRNISNAASDDVSSGSSTISRPDRDGRDLDGLETGLEPSTLPISPRVPGLSNASAPPEPPAPPSPPLPPLPPFPTDCPPLPPLPTDRPPFPPFPSSSSASPPVPPSSTAPARPQASLAPTAPSNLTDEALQALAVSITAGIAAEQARLARERSAAADVSDTGRPRPPSPPLPQPSPDWTFRENSALQTSAGGRRTSTTDRSSRTGMLSGAASAASLPSSSMPNQARSLPGLQSTSTTTNPRPSPSSTIPQPRHLPQPSTSSRSQQPQRLNQQDIILPRWQPDAEVTFCPICRTQFSIFVRKHHCRKCGRVVCNSCSPHRITIPYPYIVQPPGTSPYRVQGASGTSLIAGTDASEGVGSLGGGERVRLCNPCVPDPNTSPPSSAAAATLSRGHSRSLSSSSVSQSSIGSSSTNIASRQHHGSHFPSILGAFAHQGATDTASFANPYSHSTTMSNSSSSRPLVTPSNQQHATSQPYGGTYNSSSNNNSAHIAAMAGPSNPSQHRHHRLSLPPQHSTSASAISGSSAQPLPSFRAPLPEEDLHQYLARQLSQQQQQQQHRHHQQYQIPEEDECPVCHRELPKRSLPNFERLRENHINNCIMTHSHSRYVSGSPHTPTAAEVASSSSPASGPSASGASSFSSPASPPLPPPSPRRTGMFPYRATEKDCIDAAECTICLEEFEVGVPMARLECFCRFHERCIRAWFENRPGRCPVHQHDSFGY